MTILQINQVRAELADKLENYEITEDEYWFEIEEMIRNLE